MKTKQVRIIGGLHKRRVISFADIEGLRPTPDRLRETIFNWLAPYINTNTKVLDMCAGSGVLGFECVSRSAQHATLIEPNKKQFVMLKEAAENLHITHNVQLIHSKAQVALTKLTNTYDIIFVDPPYSLNLWQSVLQSVFDNGLYNQNTLIYIEADKPHDELNITAEILGKITPIKEKKIGQIYAAMYSINL